MKLCTWVKDKNKDINISPSETSLHRVSRENHLTAASPTFYQLSYKAKSGAGRGMMVFLGVNDP